MRSMDRVLEAQQALTTLNVEEQDERSSSTTESGPEDCQFCRSLDFDIIFAFTFAFFVGLMLISIMIFWLNGVFQYQE